MLKNKSGGVETTNVMLFTLVIDRIEEETVVCITKDHRKVIIPISCMPDDVGEGDVIYLEVRKDKEATEKASVDAKALLNELLKNDE